MKIGGATCCSGGWKSTVMPSYSIGIEYVEGALATPGVITIGRVVGCRGTRIPWLWRFLKRLSLRYNLSKQGPPRSAGHGGGGKRHVFGGRDLIEYTSHRDTIGNGTLRTGGTSGEIQQVAMRQLKADGLKV
ncbi:hypothetical protein Tco_0776431 [Tanacetum coccineum]